jgi:hypothetical protein
MKRNLRIVYRRDVNNEMDSFFSQGKRLPVLDA